MSTTAELLAEYALFEQGYRNDSLVQDMARELTRLQGGTRKGGGEAASERVAALEAKVVELEDELARRRGLDSESKRAMDKYNDELRRENSALRENSARLRAALKEATELGDQEARASEQVRVQHQQLLSALAQLQATAQSRRKHQRLLSDLDCPYPCGWETLSRLMAEDSAYLLKRLEPGATMTEAMVDATTRIILRSRKMLTTIDEMQRK